MEKSLERLQNEITFLQTALINCQHTLQLARENLVPRGCIRNHVELSINEAQNALEQTDFFPTAAETHGNPEWSQENTTDNPPFRAQYAPNGSNYHDHRCTCPGCSGDEPF